jgi:hypothetical protein
MADLTEAVEALVARALRDNDKDCEVVGFTGSGRCVEPAVAARFDGLFIDLVCAEHAERAKSRTGTTVLYPPGQEG